jgi:hypothetical protein
MSTGVTLQANQKLWGSGVAQTLTTTQGTISVPAMSNTTLNGMIISPVITNPSGAVVTTAGGNEISGLYLQNQGAHPCITATSVTGLSVFNSNLVAGGGAGNIGINASGLLGTLSVSGCTINQETVISVTNSTGSCNVDVSNSTLTANTNQAILLTLSDTAVAGLSVQNSMLFAEGNAIEVDMSGTSELAAQFNNSQILAVGYGTYLNSTAGATTIDVTMQNTSVNTEYYSIYVNQTGTLSGTFTGNALSALDDYVFYVVSSGTSGTLSLTDNQILGTDDYGVYLDQTSGSLTATIDGNLITAADDRYGIYSNISGGSQIITVNNNTISSGDYGIYIDQSGGETVNATITNNAISTTGSDYPIYYYVGGGTGSQVNISGNTSLGNYYGYTIEQASTANLDITFNDNYMIGSYYPLYLTVTSGTTTLSMSGNTLIAYETVYIDQTGGTLNATISDNTITGVASAAIYYAPSSASIATIDITGNTLSAAADTDFGAIYMGLSSSGAITTNITNNTFQATEYAVYADVSAGAPTVNVSSNSVTNGGGYYLKATAGSPVWTVNDNSFTTLSTAAVTVGALPNGNACLQLNDNTAYPTAAAYVLIQSGSGTFTLNTPEGNVGQIVETGTITPGSCP